MKLLITGAGGQVAQEIKQANEKENVGQSFELIALSREELDITSKEGVAKAIVTHRPDLIINTAAYTAVDQAEEECAQAFLVNREGAKCLAIGCYEHSLPFLHLSTDYVFDGANERPYIETDIIHPINVYGESKAQGEGAVRESLPEHVILRVSGVFGYHGRNFVKTILKLASEKQELKIVRDQIVCPTPAADIAQVCLMISRQIERNGMEWGTYHYCSTPPVSWYEFACSIIEEAKKYQALQVEKICPVTGNEFKTLAKRPAYSVLNCDKICQILGIEQRSWYVGLDRFIQLWQQEQKGKKG